MAWPPGAIRAGARLNLNAHPKGSGGLPGRGQLAQPVAQRLAAALQAVMHPDEDGYLYFVATGDGMGSHYFSRTLEEHNMAVKKYQLGQSHITLPGEGQ